MGGYADWIGPAMTPESPPSAAPKAKTSVNTRSILMPSPRGHLGVEHAGADDRAQARALDHEPEQHRHRARPNTMTKSRYDGK